MKNQKMVLKLVSFDHRSLDKTAHLIISVIKRIGDKVFGPIPLPTHIFKVSVNRSPHVHKESAEQFQKSSHSRLLIVYPSPQAIDALKRLDLPASVSVNIALK